MYKIFFSGDSLSNLKRKELSYQGYEIDQGGYSIKDDELKKIVENYDAILLGGNEYYSKEILDESNRKLKLISFLGHNPSRFIDLKAAKENNIIVTNTPKIIIKPLAEITISYILLALRELDKIIYTENQIWNRTITKNLYGQTVGIIGLGNIGARVAKILSFGFNANVIYYDIKRNIELENVLDIKYVSLEELCKKSDIITLHCTSEPENYNIINSENLNLMKNNCILINCAKAELINKEDLYNALFNNKIKQAVFYGYYNTKGEYLYDEIAKQDDLFKLGDKFKLNRYSAWTAEDSVLEMQKVGIDNMIRVLNNQICENIVKI